MFASMIYQKMKVILWSIHAFWYKGSAKNEGKWLVRKKAPLSQFVVVSGWFASADPIAPVQSILLTQGISKRLLHINDSALATNACLVFWGTIFVKWNSECGRRARRYKGINSWSLYKQWAIGKSQQGKANREYIYIYTFIYIYTQTYICMYYIYIYI